MEDKQLASSIESFKNSTSNKFLLSRLHSLLGIVPLGLFLFEHFFLNSTAIIGEQKYNELIEALQNIPFLPVIEIVFIIIPLLYHAIYGIYLSLISKSNVLTYTYTRNWLFIGQRISGIVTLVFVVYHVWSLRVATAITGTEVNFQLVSEHLHNPLIFAFYVLGIVSTSFHFCNGLSTGLITWGITIGKKSQKLVTKVCLVLFVFMSIVGVVSLIAFV